MRRLAVFLCAALCAASLSALPSGYDGVVLGMTVDEAKTELKRHAEYGFRGDRDVSLAPGNNDVLIETDASYAPGLFERCWFQFTDGKLSAITLNLDRERIDHYSIFRTLCEKYGDPQEISPQKSVWKDASVQMSLERPLVLKYVDRAVLDGKRESSMVEKTTGEKLRDLFLEKL